MNSLIKQLFKLTYRREPISGFIVVLGVTDAVIGCIDGRVSLFLVGLLVVLLGVMFRRARIRKFQAMRMARPVRYRLAPSSSRQPLPLLVRKQSRR
ncbi:MAG: hypothetical protein AAGA80_26655 [Cyanobacteria bacterium P01_F01_bin.143]